MIETHTTEDIVFAVNMVAGTMTKNQTLGGIVNERIKNNCFCINYGICYILRIIFQACYMAMELLRRC